MERTVELHALLREMLLLRHDAVHVVVAHFQPVGSGLAVRSGIGSRSTCQTVELEEKKDRWEVIWFP